jgi:hypothetical protein
MKTRLWLFALLAGFNAAKLCTATPFLPIERTYLQDSCIEKSDALMFAKNLYQFAVNKNFHDEYARYRIALQEQIAAKSELREPTTAQFAAPLLHEILTDSFMWCLHAHLDPRQYSILKGIYTTMWSGLGETGWCMWSQECLLALQKACQNKRLLYIAGGVDIAALLAAGIYDIDIIDPILETQARYYFQGFDWLTGSDATTAIGDTLEEICGDKKLTLIRIYNSSQPARCIWQVCDENGSQLGTINFTRRGVIQNDLITTSQIVISFNELIFLALPKALGGWDLNFTQIPFLKNMYVKQLPKPLDITMLRNLRVLLTMSLLDFRFIGLGNDIE